MGDADDRLDVVVVGGGTAGLTAALAARHEGASVALCEREGRIGGDCTFYGCVPSKTLIEVAQVVHDARRLTDAGLLDRAPQPAFARIAEHVAQTVSLIAHDEREERFTDAGIELVYGDARFTGSHEVAVGSRTLVAERFVLATGSEPAIPPVAGLDALDYLTNRSVFDLRELPARLVVLGGGPVGLELAQAFRRLGSVVHVVEMAERLLPRDEPEAGESALDVLESEGVAVNLSTEAQSVRQESAEIAVETSAGKLSCDALLVATGRRGATADIGLARLGVATGRSGYVEVDDRCRTAAEHVFAAGDVTGGLQFTHVASHEGAVAGRNAAGGRAKRDERVAPWVTFLDPEIAHVGLTESEARARYGEIRVVRYPMSHVDRARIEGKTVGFVKLVVRKRPIIGWTGGGELVGAQIVGPRAGESIQECALAMRTRAFAGRLAQTIHPYPATSLSVQQAASQLFPLGRVLVENDEP